MPELKTTYHCICRTRWVFTKKELHQILSVRSYAASIKSPKKVKGSSQFKGVHWAMPHKKWRARIKKDKKELSLGYFHSEIAAALVYNKAARELFGENAYLNPI